MVVACCRASHGFTASVFRRSPVVVLVLVAALPVAKADRKARTSWFYHGVRTPAPTALYTSLYHLNTNDTTTDQHTCHTMSQSTTCRTEGWFGSHKARSQQLCEGGRVMRVARCSQKISTKQMKGSSFDIVLTAARLVWRNSNVESWTCKERVQGLLHFGLPLNFCLSSIVPLIQLNIQLWAGRKAATASDCQDMSRFFSRRLQEFVHEKFFQIQWCSQSCHTLRVEAPATLHSMHNLSKLQKWAITSNHQ